MFFRREASLKFWIEETTSFCLGRRRRRRRTALCLQRVSDIKYFVEGYFPSYVWRLVVVAWRERAGRRKSRKFIFFFFSFSFSFLNFESFLMFFKSLAVSFRGRVLWRNWLCDAFSHHHKVFLLADGGWHFGTTAHNIYIHTYVE